MESEKSGPLYIHLLLPLTLTPTSALHFSHCFRYSCFLPPHCRATNSEAPACGLWVSLLNQIPYSEHVSQSQKKTSLISTAGQCPILLIYPETVTGSSLLFWLRHWGIRSWLFIPQMTHFWWLYESQICQILTSLFWRNFHKFLPFYPSVNCWMGPTRNYFNWILDLIRSYMFPLNTQRHFLSSCSHNCSRKKRIKRKGMGRTFV